MEPGNPVCSFASDIENITRCTYTRQGFSQPFLENLLRFSHRHHSMLAKVIKTDPDAIRAALLLHKRNCSVITGTEATCPKWDTLLTEDGWQAFHEVGDYGRGDPWVSWDPALWTLAANWTLQLSAVTYNGRRCHAAVAVLDHKGFGRRVAFISVHFPAHLEGDMRRDRATTRTRAYRSALAGLRDLVAHLRVEHPNIRIVLAADWNLNIRRAWVRGLLRHGLRTTGLTLVNPLPDKGTHGKRLIDWAATDLNSTGGVLPHISPFDHDPIGFTHKETTAVTWRVATSLDVLLADINKAFPNRSKVSDGSIGDAAHASRDSDHNPFVVDAAGVGVVRARDFTHDPNHGLDCNVLAERLARKLRRGRHPALQSGAYVIWNRRIISRDRIAEGWRAYTGSNPHDKHLHLSVALGPGYDSERAWWVFPTRRELAVTVLRTALDKAKAAGNTARATALRLALRAVRKG